LSTSYYYPFTETLFKPERDAFPVGEIEREGFGSITERHRNGGRVERSKVKDEAKRREREREARNRQRERS